MDLKVKDLALLVVFSSLYAGLTVLLAPISYGLIQVRLSDALIPLSTVFGYPVIFGVAIGCFVANFFSPIPLVLVDVVFGSAANLLASFLAYKIGSKFWLRDFMACFSATITITLIVGSYLAFITQMPYEIWWISIFLGSLVSINILGYILLRAFRKK